MALLVGRTSAGGLATGAACVAGVDEDGDSGCGSGAGFCVSVCCGLALSLSVTDGGACAGLAVPALLSRDDSFAAAAPLAGGAASEADCGLPALSLVAGWAGVVVGDFCEGP